MVSGDSMSASSAADTSVLEPNEVLPLPSYHFLPFLWGSGQLSGHKHLRPKAIHDDEMLEMFASEYMYLASVSFINSIKTASLSWHSPMLNDISAVKTWDKVNSGMIKMYRAEVLGKLPVVQHFLFGELLPFPEGVVDESQPIEVDSHGHVHADAGWTMDCCGIPGGFLPLSSNWRGSHSLTSRFNILVPSAFGAAAAAAAKGADAMPPANTGLLQPRGGLKPIPFD